MMDGVRARGLEEGRRHTGCRGSKSSTDAGAAGTGEGSDSGGDDRERQFYESALVRKPKTENV
jgi:hypothetical protein